MTVWTDDMMLAALRMADAGKTTAEIARALGVTRNAVLGTLKRIRDDLAASAKGA